MIQAWAATQSEFMALYESGLRSYVTDHPEVNDYARFRAAGERFGRNFRDWPSTAKSGLLRWNDVDPTLVRYHLFAQWIIDGQMTELSQRLAQRGQTLQLDIPIGVHPDGYDVWKNPTEYVTSMSHWRTGRRSHHRRPDLGRPSDASRARARERSPAVPRRAAVSHARGRSGAH